MTDMNPETLSVLRQIAEIQHSRRLNWRTGRPASDELEAAHQLELSALRNRLSDPRVRESETPPASQPGKNQIRGVRPWLVGNLFNSLIRCFR